ncbi:MAG TPA: GDP-L-fucose synthase [Bacteroidales bacterium]|nr:GDP-L-fucose synthase [Bacteroidales bacterium]
MEKTSKIYIAGHNGLVGSAISRGLKAKGYTNLVGYSFSELDLRNQAAVDAFFEREKPDYVFLAAAKVGGIMANNVYRADFIAENLMIQTNIIYSAWKNNVKKLLFLGSTCIYPKEAPQPMKEQYLLTSPLEQTNEPYAIAKIAGLKMCESFNRQYGTDYIAVMPTNLYGPGDNFDLEKSHVLPAMLRKMHLAAALERSDWAAIRKDFDRNPVEGVSGKAGEKDIIGKLSKYGITLSTSTSSSSSSSTSSSTSTSASTSASTLTLWGTGTPLREFMYSEEMAAACIHLMENISAKDIVKMNGGAGDAPQFVNIGTSKEVTIRELAYIIKKVTGFKGEILFDPSKPDGTMRKLTDTTLLKSLGFESKISLEDGVGRMYEEYLRG